MVAHVDLQVADDFGEVLEALHRPSQEAPPFGALLHRGARGIEVDHGPRIPVIEAIERNARDNVLLVHEADQFPLQYLAIRRAEIVQTDPGLLEQAIVNILENAIAYSPNPSKIEVAAYEDRGNVVVSIEDEGPGIPQADIERIFEKFRRLEEPSDRGRTG